MFRPNNISSGYLQKEFYGNYTNVVESLSAAGGDGFQVAPQSRDAGTAVFFNGLINWQTFGGGNRCVTWSCKFANDLGAGTAAALTRQVGFMQDSLSLGSPSANMTSLNLISTQPNGIGAGSRIIVIARGRTDVGMRSGAIEAIGGIKNAWKRIYTHTFDSFAGSLNIQGLDCDADGGIYVLDIVRQLPAVPSDLDLRLHGLTGNVYETRYLRGAGTSLITAKNTAAWITLEGSQANAVAMSRTLINAKSGRAAYVWVDQALNTSTGLETGISASAVNLGGANLTELNLFSHHASGGFAAGSVVDLYKLDLV